MKVIHYYSACVGIHTPDVRLLCDPWWTPGWAYDGAWGQYPLTDDPIGLIGEYDLIWISHLHQDHYDPPFLRRYLTRYPHAKLIAGTPRYLRDLMRRDGFDPVTAQEMTVGGTALASVLNGIGPDPIDSALVVRHGGQSVVNLNDNPFDPTQLELVQALTGGRCDVALLPYSGAGPYPQTFQFPTEADQRVAAERKRQQFLDGFHAYRKALNPRWAVPFAGQYWLTGTLARLNPLRGVPDPVEFLTAGDDGIVVLDTDGVIDTERGVLGPVRTAPWDPAAIATALEAQAFPLPWERTPGPLGRPDLPIAPLLKAAVARANAAVACDGTWALAFTTEQGTWTVRPGLASVYTAHHATTTPPAQGTWTIHLPARYLFGLLTRLWHWNNAEVGSLFRSRREPDVFRSELSAWLAHLQV